MAGQPHWTQEEWAVLVDLVVRFEGDVPEREIERAQHVLRATALTSEDPFWRRSASNPSFRSLGGVWTQYYVVRRARTSEVERRRAPRHLREVWDQLARDPQYVGFVAQQMRRRVSGRDNPYEVTDQAALRLFLTDIVALLGESVELMRGLPGSRADPELISAHTVAWTDLQQRELIPAVLDELERPEVASSLAEVGLTGVQLGFKLTGWLRALTEWRDTMTADALRRAFRWANLVLGSLGQALAGPGLDMLKEFKEGTEAVLDEATPPGGYLPAPAYS